MSKASTRKDGAKKLRKKEKAFAFGRTRERKEEKLWLNHFRGEYGKRERSCVQRCGGKTMTDEIIKGFKDQWTESGIELFFLSSSFS